MSEKTRVIKRYKSFILGFCLCGCGKEIGIVTKHNHLKRFEWMHGNGRGEYSHRYKRGYRKSRKGYIILIKRGHPNSDKNGFIPAHRWIMSEWLERPLEDDEEVHHIDGNKENNLIFNLQLVRHDYHGYIEKKKNMGERFCFLCKSKTTLKRKSKVKTRDDLPDIDCWRRHPITKEEWICHNCCCKILWDLKYRDYRRNNKKKKQLTRIYNISPIDSVK
jgi:hypothetical protein